MTLKKTLKKYVFSFALLITLYSSVTAENTSPKEVFSDKISSKEIQNPIVAGRFYANEKNFLKNQIDQFIKDAKEFKSKNKVLGMVVPHAGYLYSGSIAGYAYKYIRKIKPKKIVIIAPSHFINSRYVSILNKDYYKTPLGLVPIDKGTVNKLINEYDFITYNPSLYLKEHSLEVQIPFIQRSTENVEIIPIIVGNNSIGLAKKLAKALFETFKGEDVFYLASSDMSHYHPYNFANRMDEYTLQTIQSLNSKKLFDDSVKKKSELCGLGPVITLMELFKMSGYGDVDVLKYANSGDTSGDKKRVVGYSAISFSNEDYLSKKEKKELIDIAKKTIKSYVTSNKIPELTVENEILKQKGAAFVTVKKNGKLRGCIGRIAATMPLYKTVQAMAIAAVSKDTRFNPVEIYELENIDIEISVLTPIEKVFNLNEIMVGRDGLLIRKGVNQGVFLPQVPTNNGWSKNKYLEQLSIKAKLQKNAYEEGAELYKFQAVVFDENHIELID